MPTYVIVNRAPQGFKGSAESMTNWNTWFANLGAQLTDRGNPVFRRVVRGNCSTDTVLGGYTLITADNLDAAVALTDRCPALDYGGGVEVGELLELNRGTRPINDDPA